MAAPARGYSLLELVIVVILFALLLLLALDRTLPLRGQAEAAAVMRNEGILRAALGAEVAQRVARQGLDALPALEGSNPMDLTAQPPPGYLGAMPQVDPAALPPGSWAFDRARGVLVYRVRYAEYFDGEPDDPPRAEWRIVLWYAPGQAPEPGNLRGVLLQPLGRPHWRVEGNAR